jgi:hypothetical protein
MKAFVVQWQDRQARRPATPPIAHNSYFIEQVAAQASASVAISVEMATLVLASNWTK